MMFLRNRSLHTPEDFFAQICYKNVFETSIWLAFQHMTSLNLKSSPKLRILPSEESAHPAGNGLRTQVKWFFHSKIIAIHFIFPPKKEGLCKVGQFSVKNKCFLVKVSSG